MSAKHEAERLTRARWRGPSGIGAALTSLTTARLIRLHLRDAENA
jgi:hypothetical protein